MEQIPASNHTDSNESGRIQLSDHFTYGRLIRFAAPSIFMMLFTSIYGVVDGFFISNYIGKTPFAAINLIMPFLIMLGALGSMIGTGGSALIGKLLGEGKPEKAKGVFSMLVCFSLLTSSIIASAGILLIRPIALLLGADTEMVGDCVLYGRITLLSLPFMMLQYSFQSFFVTAEKPKLGLYVTIAAGVMNIILDALLIGVCSFGVAGAAAATALSELTGGLIPLLYFLRPNDSLLRLGRPDPDIKALGKTLWNGASEFVSTISMSAVSMLYNMQLMKYAGQNGVAAYGTLMYVCLIFIGIFIGFSVGTAPVISFHYGAENRKELHSLLTKSLVISGCFAVCMLLAGELFADPLARIFVGYDADLMRMTLHAFRIFSFSFLFTALPVFGSSFFTALNDGTTSAAISFLRTVVFEAASVLLLPRFFGLDGIWASLVVAEVAASALTFLFLHLRSADFGY